MIGYNPPTAENPFQNLPNTRVTKTTRAASDSGMGVRLNLEFQGPFEELDNETELLAAATAWMLKENLLGFALDYPIGRITRVYPDSLEEKESKEGETAKYDLYSRKFTYIHPGI